MTSPSRLERLPQALQRRFELIIFDWDGTAVPDRRTPVPDLNRALEALLLRGVWIAPVTGTKVENLENQSLLLLSPEARAKNLIVCTNRGSEVWSYDAAGVRRQVYGRLATDVEEQQLTAAAEELQRQLRARGLETEIIYKRLNRRKVDLIPLPEWADPPKAKIGDLIAATRERVRAAGFGEIGDVIELAAELARGAGLAQPRITSDGKYVEIGLTDKGDSVAWLLENVAQENGIDNDDDADRRRRVRRRRRVLGKRRAHAHPRGPRTPSSSPSGRSRRACRSPSSRSPAAQKRLRRYFSGSRHYQ